MVYSACVAWFQDWVEADPPILYDEWDLNQWMLYEMRQATHMFLQTAFHSHRARNDAVMILRALYYEYFLFQKARALAALSPRDDVVARLPHAPQTPQKTAAWHAESREMLSGHEFGGVIEGGAAEYNAILAKKCGRVIQVAEEDELIESQTVYVTPPEGLSPFKWGWRYEPVARDIFERCFTDAPACTESAVYDALGRIKHPSLPRLGASPDGLITAGPKRGRLLELKCPTTRVLNGSIPFRYWVQMQLQAEVCDTDAVEYFEVALGAATDPSDETLLGSVLPWIGKVCVVAPSVDAPLTTHKYAYSPLYPATASGAADVRAWKPEDEEGELLEVQIWWVKAYTQTTVLRNKRWWSDVGQPAYEKLWADVEAARADGRYKPRADFVSDTSSISGWTASPTGTPPSSPVRNEIVHTFHDAESEQGNEANDDSECEAVSDAETS